MIDLKLVINQYPECIESKSKFNAILNDLYTKDEDRDQIYFLSLIVQTSILKTMQIFHSLEKMEIDNFTNILKTKYGITNEKAFEILRTWATALDVDFKYENEFIKNRKIIEREFKETFNQIQWERKVVSTACTFDCGNAMFMKRQGDYVEANREYIRLYKHNKVLHTDFALWWYKVLCCAGDIADAITILGFAMEHMDYSANEYNMQLKAHYYMLIFSIENEEGCNIIEYLKSLSGQSNYFIREEDCNIPLKTGFFKREIDELKNDNPKLYWYITSTIK